MKKTYCNPLDFSYRYQHFIINGQRSASREGADPTLVYFKEMYYMFVSVSAGFWYSKDLLNWEFHSDENLLIYDYAPDVRKIGEYLYFCASRRGENCPILRTKDPLSDEFTQVSAPFPFWDPDLFCDDDGKVYLYWGCSNMEPIYGVEMDPERMFPLGSPVGLIGGRETELGYERAGENGVVKKEGMLYDMINRCFNEETGEIVIPEDLVLPEGFDEDVLSALIKSAGRPYIEGPFMTKHKKKYYLQYACPGTELNTYSDGVYTSDSPLGPFTLQRHNPFSSKPGGFICGAGHGSTIQDKHGNYWHASTMRISVNHSFERRIGLFPSGFDQDGVLFCNQNFADYPYRIPEGKFNAVELDPEWMLLSYKKPVASSSVDEGSDAARAVDEDIRTWWSAANASEGEWLMIDLEKISDVRAIQVNLADEAVDAGYKETNYQDGGYEKRYIETNPMISNYVIEASTDGKNWLILESVSRDCSNGYYEYPDEVLARYIKVTGGKLPYEQVLRISGLRIFGNGDGDRPPKVQAKSVRTGNMDGLVLWEPVEEAQGYNVRYGVNPEKLYSSWQVYDTSQVNLSTLVTGQEYFVRVDSFNENGITKGDVIAIQAGVKE